MTHFGAQEPSSQLLLMICWQNLGQHATTTTLPWDSDKRVGYLGLKKLLKIGTMLDRTSDAVKQRKHPEKCPYLSYQWVKPQFFDGSIPIPAGFMQKSSLHFFIQNPSPSFWRFSASCRSASRGVLGNSRRGRLGKNGGVVGQLVKSYGNIPDVLN